MWSRSTERAGPWPRGAAFAMLAAAALGVAMASAEPMDPGLPHRLVAGPPSSPAPMSRVTGARDGMTHVRLPTAPRVLWRARMPGGIGQSVVAGADGALVAASPIAQLSQLDSEGALSWSARTSGSIVTGPVITADHSRWVATKTGRVVAHDPDGRRRFDVSLGTRKPAVPMLAMAAGGAVVAAGTRVRWLESDGSTRTEVAIESDVGSVVGGTGSVLLVTRSGDVYEWHPPSPPKRRGSFGGRVTQPPARFGGSLFATVDGRRIVALDLATGIPHTRVPSSPFSFAGPPTMTRDGETRIVTTDGLLLGHDRHGRESLRVALEPLWGTADAGAARTGGSATGATIVVDARGTVGFARPGLDAGVATAAGDVRTAHGAACSEPVSVTPAGPGRMAVACRSGLIWMLGD